MPTYETVTIARNESSNIGPTLASLQDQTLRPSECIVVDDGSDDGTGDIASQLGCTVLRLPPHPKSYLGRPELASVLNVGLRTVSSGANYVVTVDADNPLPSGYVEQLLGLMESEEGVVAASGMVVGEPVDLEMPRNSGFAVECAAWRELNGMQYPLIYGYESWLRFKFIQAGMKAKVYPQVKSRVGRKTRLKGYNDGRAMYVLGYDPVYATARVAVNLRSQPVDSLRVLAGYFLRGGLEKCDIAGWVSIRQRRQFALKVRQRIVRVL